MAACVHVMPVCSVGAPVVSGVALVLWLCVVVVIILKNKSCIDNPKFRNPLGKLEIVK